MSEHAYIVVYSRSTGAYGFGDPLRVLWECSAQDARRICSDERTMGPGHFLGWTYVRTQRIRWVRDDGRYDQVLADLGLVKQRHERGRVVLVRREDGAANGED